MENDVTPKPLDGIDSFPIYDVHDVSLAQMQADKQVRNWASCLAKRYTESPRLKAATFSSSL